MKTLAKTLTLALAASGLATSLATPAFADTTFGDDAPRRTAQVSFGDIDLDTAAGQKALDKRIERAVRDVCRTTSLRTGTRIMDREAQDCRVRARTEAQQQIAALIADTQRGG